MGPLSNRHEAFCRFLAEGLSITESYERAGYKRNRGNSARLNADERIRARVAELQQEAAKKSVVTIESVCRELDEATAVAKSKGQAQAMVSAATLRAKLAGLMVEKVEIGKPGDFDGLESTAQIVDRELELLIEQFKPIDEADRQGLIALHERHLQEAREFIDAIRARPIVAERVDARRLDTPWQQLKRHSPPLRLTKGQGSKT
jgi:vacuolar-type H+-ATPase subunit F/Vma7